MFCIIFYSKFINLTPKTPKKFFGENYMQINRREKHDFSSKWHDISVDVFGYIYKYRTETIAVAAKTTRLRNEMINKFC